LQLCSMIASHQGCIIISIGICLSDSSAFLSQRRERVATAGPILFSKRYTQFYAYKSEGHRS
jgi:hypothetical protein